MFHCENPDVVYKREHVPFWLVSAFKAGFINSAGFLLAGEFVSHVTGFGTRVGMSVGLHDYFLGLELLMLPFAFIMGGVATSAILDRHYEKDEIPKYYQVQGLITLLIGVIIIMGESPFLKDNLSYSSDGNYSFLELSVICILCFICGLKNSMVAWTTYGKVRVTHLTGLSTDIGLHMIRMFNPNQPSPKFKDPPIVNWIRIFILISFFLGAMISAVTFPYLGYKTFLIVFVISLGMTIVSIKKAVKIDLKDMSVKNSHSKFREL